MCVAGIELKCSGCKNLYRICAKCYRGHVYCSDECRVKTQREKQKEASKKYSNTDNGRKKNRRRQNRYRKKDLDSKKIKKNVTHETSIKGLSRLKVSQALKKLCVICGTFIEHVVGGLHEYFVATRPSYRST
jgi:hypothetical protein